MRNKPIVFIDLETTGTSTTKDRIVEIAMIRLGSHEERLHTKINPGIPIPAGASEVHGIYDADVADAPTFQTIAPMVIKLLEGADIAGYNSNSFDIPLLLCELERIGIVVDIAGKRLIDACVIFKRKEERTLSAAVKFYLGGDHDGAHSALADVEATISVLKAMQEKYEDIGDMDRQQKDLYCNYDEVRCDIAGFFKLVDNQYVFNKGKHANTLASTEPGYLQWMLKSDFPADTKSIIHKILNNGKV